MLAGTQRVGCFLEKCTYSLFKVHLVGLVDVYFGEKASSFFLPDTGYPRKRHNMIALKRILEFIFGEDWSQIFPLGRVKGI